MVSFKINDLKLPENSISAYLISAFEVPIYKKISKYLSFLRTQDGFPGIPGESVGIDWNMITIFCVGMLFFLRY